MKRSRLQARPTATLVTLVVVLAVASLLSNITTVEQLSGQQETLNSLRKTASKLLNAGTVWAGLGFFSGWLYAGRGRQPYLLPAVAASAASLTALALHYALGNLLGIMELSIWIENLHWFAAAVLISAPLGVAGALSVKNNILGYGLRFLVPVGALIEPLYKGLFWFPPGLNFPRSEVFSSYALGVLLLCAGAVGLLLAARSVRRSRALAGTDAPGAR